MFSAVSSFGSRGFMLSSGVKTMQCCRSVLGMVSGPLHSGAFDFVSSFRRLKKSSTVLSSNLSKIGGPGSSCQNCAPGFSSCKAIHSPCFGGSSSSCAQSFQTCGSAPNDRPRVCQRHNYRHVCAGGAQSFQTCGSAPNDPPRVCQRYDYQHNGTGGRRFFLAFKKVSAGVRDGLAAEHS